MRTSPKFSRDVVPLSDLKVNPGRVVHLEGLQRKMIRDRVIPAKVKRPVQAPTK